MFFAFFCANVLIFSEVLDTVEEIAFLLGFVIWGKKAYALSMEYWYTYAGIAVVHTKEKASLELA